MAIHRDTDVKQCRFECDVVTERFHFRKLSFCFDFFFFLFFSNKHCFSQKIEAILIIALQLTKANYEMYMEHAANCGNCDFFFFFSKNQ